MTICKYQYLTEVGNRSLARNGIENQSKADREILKEKFSGVGDSEGSTMT